jgi:hypothetical protein
LAIVLKSVFEDAHLVRSPIKYDIYNIWIICVKWKNKNKFPISIVVLKEILGQVQKGGR